MIRENSKIPYKTSFQIEIFGALRAPYASSSVIKVQRSTGRESLTAKSRVAEKHIFMFTRRSRLEAAWRTAPRAARLPCDACLLCGGQEEGLVVSMCLMQEQVFGSYFC